MTTMTNPFPGPRPYTRDDAKIYPGRREEMLRVIDYIRVYPCFLLHGPSSAGKSSLMQAAVLPELENQPRHPCTASVLQWPEDRAKRPSKHLIDTISDVLRIDFPEYEWSATEEGVGKDDWHTKLNATINGLGQQIARQIDTPIVVFLDQLEQIFIGSRRVEVQIETLRAIDLLLGAGTAEFRIVMAIREDYVGMFRHRARAFPRLLERALRLGPLTVGPMTDSVCRVARGGGQEPRPDWAQEWASTSEERASIRALVAQMCVAGQGKDVSSSGAASNTQATDVGDDVEVEAAFVQIVCQQVFERRYQKAKAAWPALPKEPQEILHDYLTKSLDDLGLLKDEAKAFLHAELIDKNGKRRIRTRAELDADGHGRWNTVISKLVEKAIIRRTRHEGTEIVELAHDWLAARLFKDAAEEEATAKAVAAEAARAETEKKAALEKAKAEKEALEARAEAEKKAALEKADKEKKALEARAEAEKKAALELAAVEKQAALEKTAQQAIRDKDAALRALAAVKEKEKTNALDAAAKRVARRVYGVIAVVVAAVVLGIGLKLWVDKQAKDAEEEKSKELAEQGRKNAQTTMGTADEFATISAKLLADGQFTPSIVAFKKAVGIASEARKTAPEPIPWPPLLVLGSARASTQISDTWVISKGGHASAQLVAGHAGFVMANAQSLVVANVPGGVQADFLQKEIPIPRARRPIAPLSLFLPIDGFSGPLEELAVVREGDVVIGVGRNGERILVDRNSGAQLALFRSSLGDVQVQPSRDGHQLLLTSGAPELVREAVFVSNGEAKKLDLGLFASDDHQHQNVLALSRDGSRIVGLDFLEPKEPKGGGGKSSPAVELFTLNPQTLAKSKPVELSKSERRTYAIAADGRFVAIATERNEILIWSIDDDGRVSRIGPITGLSSEVVEVTFARIQEATWLVARARQGVVAWDVDAVAKAANAKRFDISTGTTPISVAVEPDGKRVLVRRAQDVTVYEINGNAPATRVASANLPELSASTMDSRSLMVLQQRARINSEVSVFFRQEGKVWSSGVLTVVDDVVRVRWLDGRKNNADVPRDRFLWERAALPPPTSLYSLPLAPGTFPFVDEVVRDGSRLGMVVDGQLWMVTEASDMGAPFAAQDVTPPRADVQAVAMKGGSTAVLDSRGYLYAYTSARVSTDKRTPPVYYRMRPRTLGNEPDGSGVAPQLVLSSNGKWAATVFGGATLTVWELKSGEDAWTAYLKTERAAEPWARVLWGRITSMVVGDARRGAPWVIVGDANGRLGKLFTVTDKAGWWKVEAPFKKFQHRNAVNVIEEGAPGTLASGAVDGTLAIWNEDGDNYTLKNPKETKVSDEPITAIRFVPDGSRVIVGMESGRVQVRNTHDGTLFCEMKRHHAAVVAVDPEPTSGKQVLSRDERGVAVFWTIEEKDCPSKGTFAEMKFAGFLPEPKNAVTRLVTVPEQNRIEFREKPTTKGAEEPEGATAWGTVVHSGKIVFGDDTGGVFELAVGLDMASPEPKALKLAMSVKTFSASNGDRAVVVDETGKLLAWEKGEQIQVRNPSIGRRIRAAALSNTGRLLVVDDTTNAESKSNLNLRTFAWGQWDKPDKPEINMMDQAEVQETEVFVFAYAVNDELVVLVLDGSGSVRFIHENGQIVEMPGLAWRSGTRERVVSAAINVKSDGTPPNRLVLGSADGTVMIWEIGVAPERKLSLRVTDRQRHGGAVKSIAMHPGGRFAVTVGSEGRAWLWDVDKGNAVVPLGNAQDDAIEWAVFDGTGDEVVTGGRVNASIRTWATPTETLPTDLIEGLRAFLP